MSINCTCIKGDVVKTIASLVAALALSVSAYGQACGDPDAGSCCEANGTPACDDTDCCNAVCAIDPFCCDTAWDGICQGEALAEPLCSGPGEPCEPPPPQDCCDGTETPEAEACGDDTNGGCNVDPPAFEAADCGSVICGTGWADGLRDTDWFLVSLPDLGGGQAGLRGVLESDFPGVNFIVDGIAACAPVVVGDIGCAQGCKNIANAFACLPAPNDYVVFVAPGNCDGSGVFAGFPCGSANSYRLTITCEPCEVPVCDNADGNCFDPDGNGTPGCNDPTCCQLVCDADPFCCDNTWDGLCASTAQELCGNAACNPDAGPCGEPNGTPGCEDPVCCKKICLQDPFCCDTEWDGICASAALEKCIIVQEPPNNDNCESRRKIDNGSTEFDTTLATTDGPQPCGLIGNDIWFNYDADFTGNVIIDTCGSSFDTVIAVYEGCGCKADIDGSGMVGVTDLVELVLDWLCTGEPGECIGDINNSGQTDVQDLIDLVLAWGPCPPCPGALIDCNDDCGGDPCAPLQSCLVIATVAGECYKIQVGGFNGAVGEGVLNIKKDNVCNGADGNCALPNGTPGCDELECCKLVCEIDPFCCDNQWDQLCADEAIANCLLPCPGEGGDCFIDGGNGTPGCDDVACCKKVCELDPFCCETSWDGICAAAAQELCNACNGTDGDCCDPAGNGTPGCEDIDCCKLICQIDPFCCDTSWDAACASQANDLCTVCNPVSCCDGTETPEAEACGDDTNGGCNVDPPAFELAACGSSICGTSWADGLRDTDWYLVSLPDPDGNGEEELSSTLASAFPGVNFIVDGIIACAPVVVGDIGCGDLCANIAPAVACLPAPADYVVFVAPGLCDGSGVFAGFPCGGGANEYRLDISCGPCGPPPAGPPNDDCADATPAFDGDNPHTNIMATTDGPPLEVICDKGFGLDLGSDVWYTYVPTCTGIATVSLCDQVDYDSRCAAYTGDCAGGLVQIACNDDGPGCGGFTSLMEVPVVMGEKVLLRIGGFGDPGAQGSGTMTITCGPAPVPPSNGVDIDPVAKWGIRNLTPSQQRVPE